jgi:hypothetical protein
MLIRSPARRVAFKLRQLKDNPKAQYLAAHHAWLAKAIQERDNQARKLRRP